MSKVVLITGCSTGIGRDLAQRLTEAGYRVAATARKADTLEDLPTALKISLDVTQPDAVNRAVTQTVETFGRIDVLVNNAGYAQFGAVEEIPVEKVEQMFDVNVFGTLRMIRAVVPHMRVQQSGRIINISSVTGKFCTPANGTYSASKFALEALSDALRLELALFGIHVVVIEPGMVKTHFHETLQDHARTILTNPESLYRTLYQVNDELWAIAAKQEAKPEVVSRVIQRAIETRRPKARYQVNIPFAVKVAIRLGDSVRDLALRRTFKLDPSNMK